MKSRNLILLMTVLSMVISLTGCSNSARQEAAERRWQKTIDQARIEAAEISIEEGQMGKARKILEDLSTESLQSENARELQARLESDNPQL